MSEDPLFAGEPAQHDDEQPTSAPPAVADDAELVSNGDRRPAAAAGRGGRFGGSLRDALTGGADPSSTVGAVAEDDQREQPAARSPRTSAPVMTPMAARSPRPRRPILRDEVYTQRIEAGRELRDSWLRWLLERARELLRSPGERGELALDAQVAGLRGQTVSGTWVIALVSPRGGVGKTSLAYVLGSMIADATRMSVVAVDGDLDYGPLADLADDAGQAALSLADALRDFPDARPALARLSPYLSSTPAGLRILAAPADREEMKRLGPAHYDRLLELLGDAEIVLIDCPGGIERGIPEWAIARADHLVVVTEPK